MESKVINLYNKNNWELEEKAIQIIRRFNQLDLEQSYKFFLLLPLPYKFSFLGTELHKDKAH